MALPTYTLSTSVANVDCLTSSKVVLLPPASTIQGVSLYIRDCAGIASAISTIYVSTQGLDTLDRYAIRLPLSTPYQSIRVVAWKPTEYAILQNYTYGLSPFLVQFTQGLAWTPRASSQAWTCAASSSSGGTQLAGIGGGSLYISTDGGVSWNPTGPTFTWSGVAMSSNATKMVAVSTDDRIYTSANGGTTWTPRASLKTWSCVCSSQDGSVLLAGTTADTLYLSTDSGVTWSSVNSVSNYTSVACSATGSILYAVASGDRIYVSTDTGATWTARDSIRNWTGVACTSDGVTAFATESSAFIYKTTDTGANWTATIGYTGSWGSIVCSSTASIVVAYNSATGYLNFSENAGASYTNSGDIYPYSAIAMNGTGSSILAATNPGFLYVGAIQLL